MKFGLLLSLLFFTFDTYPSCYRGAEHVLTCRTQFVQKVGASPIKRCPVKMPKGHVCAGINLEVQNAEMYRVCRVCWDNTGESITVNSSDRSIIRTDTRPAGRRIPRHIEDLEFRGAGDN